MKYAGVTCTLQIVSTFVPFRTYEYINISLIIYENWYFIRISKTTDHCDSKFHNALSIQLLADENIQIAVICLFLISSSLIVLKQNNLLL